MNLAITSQFRPFTYDELVKPFLQYKEAYEKAEQDYSNLSAQTEMWKDIANQTSNPEAYAMYQRYSTDLNSIMDDFSRGMNVNNRRALLGMKRRYYQDIQPIADASAAMKEANQLRDKAGPDAIFEIGRYNSIDDFLHGKTANNKFESRKDIASMTAALTQATVQSILNDPIIRQSMNPQFLEIIQKRGLGSLDDLQSALSGSAEASNRFSQIKNQIIDQIGGLDRFDSAGKAAVDRAINEGLYAGLDNYQTSLQQNGEYMTKAQRISSAITAAQLEDREEQKRLKQQQDKVNRGKRVIATEQNRADIARSRGVKPEDILLGKSYYQYIDNTGQFQYGTTPWGFKTADGSKATLIYGKSDSQSTKSNPKVGSILGVTNLRMNKGRAWYDAGTNNKVYSKDALEGATYVPSESTTLAEDQYIDQFLREHPEVKKESLAFYRQWVDEDGDVCLPNEKGAKQVLLITDKQ